MDKNQNHYQIYGRTSYETPLSFVAELVVRENVKEEALAEVGHEGWVELVAIPSAAFLPVSGQKDDD